MVDNPISIKSIKELFIGKKESLDTVNQCCRICLRKCSDGGENHRICE